MLFMTSAPGIQLCSSFPLFLSLFFLYFRLFNKGNIMTGFEPVLNETALRTEPQPLLSVQNQTNCESWDEVDWLDRLNFVCFNKKKWVASKYFFIVENLNFIFFRLNTISNNKLSILRFTYYNVLFFQKEFV